MKVVEKWQDDLIWCPSQCTAKFLVFRQGNLVGTYDMYLRWRHADPWRAYVINHMTDEWSHELFSMMGQSFGKDDNLGKIKNALVYFVMIKVQKGELHTLFPDVNSAA